MNTAKPEVTPIDRPKLSLPGNADKLLLHSCCAPCSGEVMEALLASGIDYTIYFYNPNIHPLKEYGLSGPRAWNTSPNAASAAPCVLICGLNALRFMHTNTVLR